MVYKKIRLIGRSTESFEDAVENAVERAEETLDDLRWVSVENQALELAGDEREYQTEVEVAFQLHEGADVR